jgi:predicted alpha/beta-fold hydrolase
VNRFQPAWWCRNAHLQTLWPHLFRHQPEMGLHRERLELPDGDFIDLDWTPDNRGPIVVILHGLEGSAQSPYVQGLLEAVRGRAWRGVVMHFRGCSGEPNRLARSYHSGETGDLSFLIQTLRSREPDTPLAVVGYSLGGNVLLKWLGETGNEAKVQAAVAVSVPFVLHHAADRLNQGFSRIYQWILLRSLKRGVRRKFKNIPAPISLENLAAINSLRDFDDQITAPLHGFTSADHYYSVASSRQYLKGIQVNTLIIHAQNDPFMTADAIPATSELSPSTQFELYADGGHVGFVAGRRPWRARYWLEERVLEYLKSHLKDSP